MSLVRLQRSMRRKLMPYVYAFVIIFILGVFLSFSFTSLGGARASADAVARVGAEEITAEEFAAAIRRVQEQFLGGRAGPVAMAAQASIPELAFNQMVREQAEAKAAGALGVRVSGGEAEAEARRQIEEMLKQRGAGLTPEEISRFRQQMYAGLNTEEVRGQLVAQRLREKLTGEARAVEVKVAHVLIKPEGLTEMEALRRAEDVARQAKAGVDFARLAAQHSGDEGSKKEGGVVGWASAMPATAAPEPGKKPDPNAAASFAQEFTAAALRLQPGQVSNPVRTEYGYHVIKALEQRDYQPKPEPPRSKPKTPAPGDSKEDPTAEAARKRTEAIETYRNSAASAMALGIVSDHERRLKTQIVPVSEWARGYLLEQADRQGNLAAIAQAYTEALNRSEPAAGQGLAFRIVELRKDLARKLEGSKQKEQAQAEYRAALAVLDRWARNNPEMLVEQAELQQKLGERTKALATLRTAMDRVRRDPPMLQRIAGLFKELGRKDLAAQASARQAQQQKAEDEERKRQEAERAEQMKRFAEVQKQAEKQKSAAAQGGTVRINPQQKGAEAPPKNAPPAKPAGAKPAPAAKPATGAKPATAAKSGAARRP